MDNVTPECLIETLRFQCLQRGCGGIKGLGLIFKNMDIDYSKRIVYEELRIGIHRYGIRMSESYLQTLFKTLDKDMSGGIDFREFMRALRPPMNQGRVDLINELFDTIDVDGDGVLNTDDIKARFADNVRMHPKFIQGEWTEEQTLQSFLDTFDDPDDPDGTVTREEFLNYYSGVSVMYEGDEYFDMLMRRSYGLPPKGSEKKKAVK